VLSHSEGKKRKGRQKVAIHVGLGCESKGEERSGQERGDHHDAAHRVAAKHHDQSG